MSTPGEITDEEAVAEDQVERTLRKKAYRWAKRVGLVVLGSVLTLASLFVVGRFFIGRVEPETDPHAFAPWGLGTSFVSTSEGETHVLDVGEGEVILLIHGSTGSIADWQEKIVDRLAESYRVVAFDSFGFGLSERNDSFDYGYPLWTEQAIDVLDALEINRAVVVGHSAGGFATAILAAQNPDRFRGAVLTGHGLSFDWFQLVPAVPGIGDIWAASQPIIGDAFSEEYQARAADVHRIRGTRRAYLTFVRNQYSFATLDYFNVYEEIEIPVLQMHGENDASIPIEAARDVSSRIADARFVAIANSDHFIHIDAPDQWIDEVVNFVESLPRGQD